MKKLCRLGCLMAMSALVIMATVLISCESSDNWATLTISNRSGERLAIFLDMVRQQDSPTNSIQIIEVSTNAHLVSWVGQTVQGQVSVTIPQGQNMTLKIYGGLTNYEME